MRQSDQTTECAKNVFRMTLRSEPSKTPVVSPALQAVSVTRMSSEHDQAVLNSIFNPYLPLGEGLSVSGLIEENDKNGNFVLIIMLSYNAFNGYRVFNKNKFMKSMLCVCLYTNIYQSKLYQLLTLSPNTNCYNMCVVYT